MPGAPHIVVCDDEPDIRGPIGEYLMMRGFRVSEANGAAALRGLISRGETVDLVLLDIQMPGEDGLTLTRWLREHVKMGVIIVTGSADMVDRVAGLEVGADDYVAKPFDLRELLARVRSVLRRVAAMPTRPTKSEQLRFGHFILDLAGRQLSTEEGMAIALTSTEFDLLEALATHPNRILSRDQLLDLTHGRTAEPFDRSIDIRVTRLRRKIETHPDKPGLIKTVRGAGYVFVPGESA
jgi:two-component system phosphate regulon response regulator OmpR